MKVFAPCDGRLFKIEELNDGVFSEKLIGDGFYIQPSSEDFYPLMNSSKLDFIFDTKHSFFTSSDEIKDFALLVHIGIDSVKLNGKPFKYFYEVGDKLDLDKPILKWNNNLFLKNKISSAIPIIGVDPNGVKKWEFNLLNKSNELKKGDLIGEFSLIKESRFDKEKVQNFFSSDSKWDKVSKEIIKEVGTKSNYDEVYSCMTRLRFKIKNRSLVNEKELQAIEVVKSILWNGNELQIVIGLEVDKLLSYVEKNQNINQSGFESAGLKPSIGKRLMQVIGGTIVPCIPAIIGAGMLMAVVGVLTQLKIMPNITLDKAGEGQVNIYDASVGWMILYVASNTALKFVGVLVGVMASKYFKLNLAIGTAISIIIASPIIFGTGGPNGMGYEWTLFSTGINGDIATNPAWANLSSIKVMPQGGRMFVVLIVIWFAKVLSDWIKKWMPTQLDLVFRNTLILIIPILFGFLVVGPIWYVFEQFLGAMMYYADNYLPLGLGVAIFAAIWPIAVFFGVHFALASIGYIAIVSQGANMLLTGVFLANWAQFAALLTVTFISKNSILKRRAIGTIIPGFLGITEPMIYGVNFPKFRPFVAGCLAAFFAGALAGILGVSFRVQTGEGIFATIGFFSDVVNQQLPAEILARWRDPIINGSLFVLCCFVSMGLSVVFTLILYKERLTENVQIKKMNGKVFKLINTFEKLDANTISLLKSELKNKKNYEIFTKDDLQMIKKIEKELIKLVKDQTKYKVLEEKELRFKENILKKGKKLVAKQNHEAAYKMMSIYESEKYKEQKDILNKNIILMENNLQNELNEFRKIITFKNQEIDQIIAKFQKFTKYDLGLFKDEYYNKVNDLLVVYEMDEPIVIEKPIDVQIKTLLKNQKTQKSKLKL